MCGVIRKEKNEYIRVNLSVIKKIDYCYLRKLKKNEIIIKQLWWKWKYKKRGVKGVIKQMVGGKILLRMINGLVSRYMECYIKQRLRIKNCKL